MKKFAWLVPAFISLSAFAQVPTWQIVPNESKIEFEAIQNDAPVKGKFNTFTGEIKFSPEHLAESHVKITVDTGSVNMAYHPIVDELKKADWFDTSKFPKAVFESKEIKKLDNNHYQANGTAMIRDHSLPVVVNFQVKEFSDLQAKVIGETTLKRLAYDIGKGDWGDPKEIKDEVKVSFSFVLKP